MENSEEIREASHAGSWYSDDSNYHFPKFIHN